MKKNFILVLFVALVSILISTISFVSGENVCLEDIVLINNEKIFKIYINNYENSTAQGTLFLNFSCDLLNNSITENISLNQNEKKWFSYNISTQKDKNFCECNAYGRLEIKNNKCKKTSVSKNFEFVVINFTNFPQLTTNIEGEINFDTKFYIYDNLNNIVYEGKTTFKKFSFKLKDIGKFYFKIDYCNITKEFLTKHKINVFHGIAREGKELLIYIKDENNNPIYDANVYIKDNDKEIFLGKTDIYGAIKIIPNKTFTLYIPETTQFYSLTKNIYVEEIPKIEIQVYPSNEEFKYNPGKIFISPIYNNSIISNVSVEIKDVNGKVEKFITNDSSIEYLAFTPGVYTIYAKKPNFKDSTKEISVFGRMIINVSKENPDVNETITIKVFEILPNDTIRNIDNARIKITTENFTKIGKTDIDGEINFKVPDVKEPINISAEKEFYNSAWKTINVMRELKFKLSENYLFENHYKCFDNLTIIPFSKDIPIILDKVEVITEEKNFTINLSRARFDIFLDTSGKYKIFGYKKGYMNAYADIFVEPKDIDVYISTDNEFLIINLSEKLDKSANEIYIRNLDNNKTISFNTNTTTIKLKIDEIGEGNYNITFREQYKPKFYVNNMKVNKFKIEKIYDTVWLLVSIIIILLLSTFVIVQEKYKKGK